MKKIIIASLFLFSFFPVFGQDSTQKKKRFFIEAGYGLAGSFAAIDYTDFTPVQGMKIFTKNRFLGSTQNLSIGIANNHNWEFKIGLNYQYFTKWIKSIDTLQNVVEVFVDRSIHYKNFMWYGSVHKKIEMRKNLLTAGIGLYYLVSKHQRVEIYPRYVIDKEKIWKGNKDGDAGAFVEFAYEYKFQPKVHMGLKSQFYYTVSLGYPESVTLYPYIKILFK